jgi:phospholipase/carboxylesterase
MIAENAVKIEPPEPADAAIIWLHGLGADGHDFAELPQALTHPHLRRTRYIFPHAPIRPVTLNGSYPMRAWHDIKSLTREGVTDLGGLAQSHQIVEHLIREQIETGISSHRIVLAGFSQGGAQVLYSGTRTDHAIGGIIGLSCYLPDAKNTPIMKKNFPILLMHGDWDEIVIPEYGRESAETLREANYAVELKHYAVAHGVCPAQIDDLNAWLGKQFSHPTPL